MWGLLAIACADVLGFRWASPEAVPLLGDCPAAAQAVTLWADDDGDGHGDPLRAARGCLPVAGWAVDDLDCDDTRAEAWRGATEQCNGRDDDCDLAVDELPDRLWCRDRDTDGYGDPSDGIYACEQPSTRYVQECSDCDDTDSAVLGGCGASARRSRTRVPSTRGYATLRP
jgi:hypothetical protein